MVIKPISEVCALSHIDIQLYIYISCQVVLTVLRTENNKAMVVKRQRLKNKLRRNFNCIHYEPKNIQTNKYRKH